MSRLVIHQMRRLLSDETKTGLVNEQIPFGIRNRSQLDKICLFVHTSKFKFQDEQAEEDPSDPRRLSPLSLAHEARIATSEHALRSLKRKLRGVCQKN